MPRLAVAGWSGAAGCGRAGSTLPRIPAALISWSSSAFSASRSSVSSLSFSAWSRMAWASARFSTHHFWSSVAGSGSMTGSVSRCQPSRHWAARSVLARWAQAGQTAARVCPQGTSTWSTVAGVEVGPAQLHRPDAGAVLDGQVLDDIAGERHGQPFGPGASRHVQLNLLRQAGMEQRERSPNG